MSGRDHTSVQCRWPGCPERVERWRWGCTRHWFRLPEPIRKAIVSAWAKGRGEHSGPYREAIEQAQRWIDENTFCSTPPAEP